MTRMPTSAAVIVVLAAGAGMTAPVLGDQTCHADWSVAAAVVKKEGLATVEQLLQLAKKAGAGDIVRTTLCQGDGAFVYRIVVKDAKGQLKTLNVDARKPFGR